MKLKTSKRRARPARRPKPIDLSHMFITAEQWVASRRCACGGEVMPIMFTCHDCFYGPLKKRPTRMTDTEATP